MSSIPGIPHLRQQGRTKQLVVNGRPFLVLGAELFNSSASSLEYMAPLWSRAVSTNINTLLASVSWELLEPEEDRFDFALVDGLLQDARKHGLKLILLWFASWKNGKSNYQPLWVKTNQHRFPLIQNEQRVNLPTLSAFSQANREADAAAFAALMRHLGEEDRREQTVIMVQVENEVGVLGDSRDYSAAAQEAFESPVPTELINFLVSNRDTLSPQLRQIWEANGSKTEGRWVDIFGAGKPAGLRVPVSVSSPPMSRDEFENGWRGMHWSADEVFMAWHYAKYVNSVAEAGKAEYPLPMFVNAWLQNRGNPWPGMYPSGGPVPQMVNIWQAGAPSIDFVGADIYRPEFEETCAQYSASGNSLFIPEALPGAQGAAGAIYAIGKYDAIGFSPFGADAFLGADKELANAYSVLGQIEPILLTHQGKDRTTAVLLDNVQRKRSVTLGTYDLEAHYLGPLSRDDSGQERSEHALHGDDNIAPDPDTRLAVLFIWVDTDEFLVLGRNISVYFSPNDTESEFVGLGFVDEVRFDRGRMVKVRRLNGDETPDWMALRFPEKEYAIQHVKLYRYN